MQFEDIAADTTSEVSNEIDRLFEKRSLRYGYNSPSRHLSFVLMNANLYTEYPTGMDQFMPLRGLCPGTSYGQRKCNTCHCCGR